MSLRTFLLQFDDLHRRGYKERTSSVMGSRLLIGLWRALSLGPSGSAGDRCSPDFLLLANASPGPVLFYPTPLLAFLGPCFCSPPCFRCLAPSFPGEETVTNSCWADRFLVALTCDGGHPWHGRAGLTPRRGVLPAAEARALILRCCDRSVSAGRCWPGPTFLSFSAPVPSGFSGKRLSRRWTWCARSWRRDGLFW